MSDETKNKEVPEGAAEKAPSSRRKFLKWGALTGAAGLLGGVSKIAEAAEDAASGADETVRLLSQDGKLIEVKRSELKTHAHGKIITDSEKVRAGVKGKKFVMVIDLASCRNARKCADACQASHNLWPHQEYLRIPKVMNNEKAGLYWMPQVCNQCDNPPCTKVCPVGATFKRDDGIVAIDNEMCIGCRFCMAACPYNARIFSWTEPKKMASPPPYSPETSMPQKVGTVEKCDFCVDMAREGKLPHCVTSCPNGVFYYGDENEDVVTNGSQTVRLSKLLAEKGGYRYMEELGTKPRVYYLPPRDREFPFETGEEDFEKVQEQRKDFRLNLTPNAKGHDHE